MASVLGQLPLVGSLFSPKYPSIDLESVEVHCIERAPEKRPRTLKYLLRANHVNHSILYHNLRYHNHMPHVLSSAYLIGANHHQLNKIYEAEAEELEPWKESPCELTETDWRDYLGDGNYQRAFIDFFEDGVAMRNAYDWKKVVHQYMFEGDEPLVNCLVSGLGHPLIHLGYAFEMDNKEVALEALAMSACTHNYLHKYSDDPSYTKPAPFSSTSPLELLNKIADDKRFDGIYKEGDFDLDVLFRGHESLVMEYWNAWDLSDPKKQFQLSQEAAVNLLVGTVAPGTHSYSFFLVHILTTSHAVRILLPFIPAKFHMSVVRQWWLLTIAVYVANLRPKIDPGYIDPGSHKSEIWTYVEDKAVNGPWATDAHFVKAVRAMREMSRTWGDVHERYLYAAIRFVDDFEGWVF
ncbi:hypothetical protein MKZ38_004801 [Zalerion maritima]|uniref:MGS207 protein n=1 Tax=Zalerion maritima TaxID=339359 RepID=A0AAD5RLK8_9PEZI|nr:hypothetical protein MKZ38_004801 [Zalerion maritima]